MSRRWNRPRRCLRLVAYAGLAALVLAFVALGVIVLTAGDGETVLLSVDGDVGRTDPIHGLGLSANGAGGLLVATHDGLHQATRTGGPAQISQEQQDFMGFTVAGPDRLLASGHPAPGQDLPAALGLIESRDGGRTWQPVSLLGQADFHVLRAAGERVYGFDPASGMLLASGDGGRTCGATYLHRCSTSH